MTRIRLFLMIEALAFAVAALIHFGWLVHGYEHARARIAESVIAAVLLSGWVVTSINANWARRIGIAVQAFALLGTFVGLFTVAIGIGPRTTPDIVYHLSMVALLVGGLIVAIRARPNIVCSSC